MQTSSASQEQIIGFLKQAEAGMQVEERCRKVASVAPTSEPDGDERA